MRMGLLISIVFCRKELVAWIQKEVFDLNQNGLVTSLWQYTLLALRDTLQLGYYHPK